MTAHTSSQITTTLSAIRAAQPCEEGFAKIRNHLGVSPAGAKTHDKPFPVALLLETNDLDDTLWVLDFAVQNERICRLFAADCAEQVLHLFEEEYPDDKRPRQAIEVARDPTASDAARAAARAAAWDAARAAARAAATDAARAAARAAATDAAWDAAWDAARAAATDAAWDAARAAASDAARAAALVTARDAAWATALAAARDAQKDRLRQYLTYGEAAADLPWPGVDQ
jgi:hypothetical protein